MKSNVIKYFVLVCIMMAVFLPSPSYACLSPSHESRTFLTFLPDEASLKNIVGKVEILPAETTRKGYEIFFSVRVVDPVKGLKKDQELLVGIANTTCNRDPQLDAGAQFYIAGDFSDDGNFRGMWTGEKYAQDALQRNNNIENP